MSPIDKSSFVAYDCVTPDGSTIPFLHKLFPYGHPGLPLAFKYVIDEGFISFYFFVRTITDSLSKQVLSMNMPPRC
jgi:hypothetical protein